MRILAVMITMSLGLAGLAEASTIDLNDGRTVQGAIVKQDNKSLQVNVDGVTMTYYADEIKDVDGQPLGPGQEPAVQAAAQTLIPSPSDETQSPASTTAIDPAKKALILQFMDVFGTSQAMSHNFDLMLQQVAKDKPQEAATIRQRVKIDEIIERLVPIYDRNFSSDDLKAFIAFYSSPEGEKLIHTIPELMKESVVESIKYMQEKFPELNSSNK